MTKRALGEIEPLIKNAQEALSRSNHILQELLDESDSDDGSEFQGIKALQLLLQYRFDTQDALMRLLSFDHGLLQILGIDPLHSSRINLERMEYALGNDDLHHILLALSQLINALLRIANRYQQHLDSARKMPQHSLNKQLTTTATSLQKAIKEQKFFISLLVELSSHLDAWNKLAAIGPVLDHIAALRGPISQFFQALQNGLELSHRLYEKINKEVKLDTNLANLLQQTEVVLKQLPPITQPHPFFAPMKTVTEESLERRAAIKRLGHFFRY